MTGSPWIFFFLISQTRPLGASNNLSVTAQVSPLSTDSCGDCCLWASAPLSCDSQCLSIGVSNLEGSSLPCQRRQWHPTPVLLPGKSHGRRNLLAAVHEVTKSQTWLSDFTFTFHFHALEKEMATHSSVLARRIPGTGAPGGLPSMGSHRVGHDWSDLAAVAAVYMLPRYSLHSSHLLLAELSLLKKNILISRFRIFIF